ncbi:MAG: hypothetical protein U0Q16_05290 [Bryobacteraceae bacterium]
MNPAMVVAGSLAHGDLDVRLIESLPWVLLEFADLDACWLAAQCRLLNLQNRLGFLVTLACEAKGERDHLRNMLVELEQSRLAVEGTLCRDSMPDAERVWIRKHRSVLAAHWGLLTTLSREQLRYAA